MQSGRYSDNDAKKLAMAASELSKKTIVISDKAAQTLAEIRAQTMQMIRSNGVKMIFIDYLQLMRGTKKVRQEEISEISQGLKAIQKDFNIPVIALSQLNRGVESRPDKRPMLSDLRESGAIEQDADCVIMCYRDEYYNEDSEKKNQTELIFVKNRGGMTGTVSLYSDLSTFKYMPMTNQTPF